MKRICISLCFLSVLLTSCLPGPTGEHGSRVITVYAFSIMKESLEKDIFPAFAEKWKQEHGEDVSFNTSFSGSETVTKLVGPSKQTVSAPGGNRTLHCWAEKPAD